MRGGYKPMGPRPRNYDYPLPMKGKSIFVLINRSSIARLAHGAVAQVAGAELNHRGLVRAGERKNESVGELAEQNDPGRSSARDRRE